jgi:hypothetical protein
MNGATTPELLARWYQLGAFLFPLYREHGSIQVPKREPYLYKDSNPAQFYAMITAVVDRYLMFPLIYTAVRDTCEYGRPFAAPLWFDFPRTAFDPIVASSQPIVGGKLMVVPQLAENTMNANVVKPPGRWYHLQTGKELVADSSYATGWYNHTLAFLRGGVVTAIFREYELTIKRTYEHNLTLYIAFDDNGEAHDSLYFDDQISMEHLQGSFLRSYINCSSKSLTIRPEGNYSSIPFIDEVVIYGATQVPDFVIPGGIVTFDKGVVRIGGIFFSLSVNQTFAPPPATPLPRQTSPLTATATSPPLTATSPHATATSRAATSSISESVATSNPHKRDTVAITVGVSVGAIVLALLSGLFVYFYRRRRTAHSDFRPTESTGDPLFGALTKDDDILSMH